MKIKKCVLFDNCAFCKIKQNWNYLKYKSSHTQSLWLELKRKSQEANTKVCNEYKSAILVLLPPYSETAANTISLLQLVHGLLSPRCDNYITKTTMDTKVEEKIIITLLNDAILKLNRIKLPFIILQNIFFVLHGENLKLKFKKQTLGSALNIDI